MGQILLTTEFKEFLRLLISHRVEFLLVGGYAVGYYGYPRSTLDIDLWVRRSPENAARLVAVLTEFGFGVPPLEPAPFAEPRKVFRMGVPPNRIEIITSIDGVEFEDCWPRKVAAEISGVSIPTISLEDLKTNKRASGRYKDLTDLEHLP